MSFKIKFQLINSLKKKKNMSVPVPLLSPIPLLVRLVHGYLAGVWWVQSRSLSYILADRFSVRDESHRLSRSFILRGIPKDTSIRFQRETSQPCLFTAFFNVIMIPNSPFLTYVPFFQLTFTGQSIKSLPLFCITSLSRTYLTLT